MTLEDRLERLAHRTPEGDPADVLAGARRRAGASRGQRTGSPRFFAAAAAVLAVVAVGAGALALTGDGSDTVTAAGLDDRSESSSAGAGVTVSLDGLPSVEASTSSLRPSGQGWVEHTVTLRNTGSEPARLSDLRGGDILGDDEVAVAHGCNYSGSRELACLTNIQPVNIDAGEAYEFTVTLWRDLAGMNPVTAGPHVWRLDVRTADNEEATPAAIIVTYRNLDALAGDEPNPTSAAGDPGTGEASAVREPVLPGFVPDGYRLAWVDTPAVPPSDGGRFALHERPHDYAYGYQKADSAELEVRVMQGAKIGDPQAVADAWNDLAEPMTLDGRPAVGYTDDGRHTRLLIEVDGGVAMVSTHPLGAGYELPNEKLPSRDVVERFAASIAQVSEAEWEDALASGADVASMFEPKDGVPVVEGDGWSLMHGDFRAPLSVRNRALWVDFGGVTGGAAGPGVLGEEDAWHVAIAVDGTTRVAWGILPAGAETVQVTVAGDRFAVTTVALAGTAARAFAVDVSGATGDGTFEAFGPTGAHVASGPIDVE